MSDVSEAPVPAQKPARVRKAWDIWLTIGLIVITAIVWFVGAFISYLGIAFFGSCNSNGCSGDAIINGGVALMVLGILGILASIVFLIIKRRGWPIALITLGVVGIGWIVANVVDSFR
jgi:hypothetical protein